MSDTPLFDPDSHTNANLINSAIASSIPPGTWSSPRTAADLIGVELEQVEAWVNTGMVRSERAGSRVLLDDVIRATGGSAT